MCNQNIRRVLHRYGFRARRVQKIPLVSRKNLHYRVRFAKEHLNKGQTYWKDLIWSDETKTNSVMLWGCMPARRVDNIHFIDGIMVKYEYNGILKKNVKVPSRWESQMFLCSNRTTIANTLLSRTGYYYCGTSLIS